MNDEISQVDGCAFTTDELQRFHQYYQYPWTTAGLDDETAVNKRIEYFVAEVDPLIDSKRLREWLRTMGIVDASEMSDEARLYSRFEGYDFVTAPGFAETLGDVYAVDGANIKHQIDARMVQAKAQYYNQHVEPLDYDAYQQYKEANAPKPVCPYQHMWDNADSKRPPRAVDASNFKNIKIVDLTDYFAPNAELTAGVLGRIHAAVVSGFDEKYHAVAVISSASLAVDDASSAPPAEPVFLPSLSRKTADIQQTMQAYVRLQIDLRRLNQTKPVVMFASGSVDQSALGILLSTPDIVTTEAFSAAVGPATESASVFPIAALYDWASLDTSQAKYPEGTAEYILCNLDLVLRSSEWSTLGFGSGVIAQRKLTASMERILLAASCPPPHTRDALRKAYIADSAYPGPSKVGVWSQEIARYFAPVARGLHSIDDLAAKLATDQQPWATKCLAYIMGSASAVVALRMAALRAAREEGSNNNRYSSALMLEAGATVAWSKGERSVEKLMSVADSSAPIIAAPEPEKNRMTAVDKVVPDECPFAQMYRKNPEHFKNVDLGAIAEHRALNL
ncbi:hypothetical protein H4217_002690 [Coemansia sp. RSA 1939]|nr:hypothetical protein H4217_002690 [Coemansia sp. RSA 1939]KAJ2614073.1 hypothetical protein EV177_002234 [Coemansia sp. RSA 1804]KAJ2694220.1 hypothetical protein GGH99_000775 [Coemansia sp. RSA 1285]